jgi:hypothetical protein
MKVTTLYEWPYGRESESTAREFFAKAKANFDSFPFSDDAAICLCEVSGRWCCLVFVESDTNRNDSIDRWNRIKEFLKGAGCPAEQETEDANWDGRMTLDTIDRSLSLAQVRVVERIVRRRAQQPVKM